MDIFREDQTKLFLQGHFVEEEQQALAKQIEFNQEIKNIYF
jgi:hypothetical protein